MDYSAYEGIQVNGRVDTVLSRGSLVLDGREYVGTTGHGRYVKRGLSQYLV
jgi:dihydropyrimidinase